MYVLSDVSTETLTRSRSIYSFDYFSGNLNDYFPFLIFILITRNFILPIFALQNGYRYKQIYKNIYVYIVILHQNHLIFEKYKKNTILLFNIHYNKRVFLFIISILENQIRSIIILTLC